KIDDVETLKNLLMSLNGRGLREKVLQKYLEKNFETVCQSSFKMKKNSTYECNDNNVGDVTRPDKNVLWNFQSQKSIELNVLESIEDLKATICSASLQRDVVESEGDLKREANDDEENSKVNERTNKKRRYSSESERSRKKRDSEEAGGKTVLELAKTKLLHLEHNIERRYLKPPLGKSKELLLWRSAVSSATSPSQLSLYVEQLNKCIAWEKSIMKVSCQICCSDDDEGQLLLCDMCDKGYHTYCIRPKLQSIPEGDWYCYECISKRHLSMKRMFYSNNNNNNKNNNMDNINYDNTNNNVKSDGNLGNNNNNNDTCSKIDSNNNGNNNIDNNNIDSSNVDYNNVADLNGDTLMASDMSICHTMLNELKKHNDSWPFLAPVSSKQFPTYRKVIRCPIDFQTISKRLKNNFYKNRGEFVSDIRLVFNNCEIFNEDDSTVGRAGHSLQKFFDKRWMGLVKSRHGDDYAGDDGDNE
ncbi:hypothetical protein HELRODRAFT_90399, partial [Helobdella robusta]|uniref:Bromodomain adjacent to zinc finger domain protein 2B n=1 Tax=Helobdella robusta TaxID=6412 RepID=T1G7Q8_HELRO